MSFVGVCFACNHLNVKQTINLVWFQEGRPSLAYGPDWLIEQLTIRMSLFGCLAIRHVNAGFAATLSFNVMCWFAICLAMNFLHANSACDNATIVSLLR